MDLGNFHLLPLNDPKTKIPDNPDKNNNEKGNLYTNFDLDSN